MWTLVFYIVLIVGSPETPYLIAAYPTFELCNEARIDIWTQMNAVYPPSEQKLYRFVCEKSEVKI